MAQAPTRTAEVMLAELVHHMAELLKAQAETNRLLAEMVKKSPK